MNHTRPVLSGLEAETTLSLPGGAGEVEDVELDDDVSAADLSGESLLPTSEMPAPSSEVALPGGEPMPEVTAPRVVWRAAPAAIQAQAALLLAEAERTDAGLEGPTGQTALPEEELDGGDVVLGGLLGAMPLIDVLALLARQQQTGLLVISGEGKRAEITLRRGRVALATVTGAPELRLGRFVQELGAASAAEIEQINLQKSGALRLFGQRLCEVGSLSRDDLRQALGRQTEEIIHEALRLRAGRFSFSQPAALPQHAVDRALGADLDLDLEALLLEGYRRIQDQYLYDQDLDERAIYLRTDERGPDRLALSPKEQQVLALCTGRSGVGDIARESRQPPIAVARVLRRLQAMNLVRRRLPPQASS